MITNEGIIKKVRKWLEAEGKSYKWLADQMNISKSLVGLILKGERTLKPERIEELAKIMNVTTRELMEPEVVKDEKTTVKIRGAITNPRSKRELDSLLSSIDDYVGLKEQMKILDKERNVQ